MQKYKKVAQAGIEPASHGMFTSIILRCASYQLDDYASYIDIKQHVIYKHQRTSTKIQETR